MQISKPVAEAIRAGAVTLAYRRWDAPRVKVGSTQLTSAGVVGFDAVDEVRELAKITRRDARAAGFADQVALVERLAPIERRSPSRASSSRGSKGGDKVYRIRMHWVGEDPRLALRDAVPDAAELATVTDAVAKLDAGRKTGPWTRPILEWIRDHPAVVSKELATLLDRDLLPMKADIRRLKSLGLTISLDVGYRLSPRGAAYLEHLDGPTA